MGYILVSLKSWRRTAWAWLKWRRNMQERHKIIYVYTYMYISKVLCWCHEWTI